MLFINEISIVTISHRHCYSKRDVWDEWKIKCLKVVNTHAPLRKKRVRSKRSPWITSKLKKRMHERDIMHEVESNYTFKEPTGLG